jgi:hypothetical protein
MGTLLKGWRFALPLVLDRLTQADVRSATAGEEFADVGARPTLS